MNADRRQLNLLTPLQGLGLNEKQLAVVLEEVFLVPPTRIFPEVVPPRTIEELASQSTLPVAEVIARLSRIIAMSDEIEITVDELKKLLEKEPPLLLDVRSPAEYSAFHLPGSHFLAELDLGELLPKLRAAELVVTICAHGIRSYSAAMYLKQQGVQNVKSLAGGLAAWE